MQKLFATLLLALACSTAWPQSAPAFAPGNNGASGNTASIAVTASAQNLNCDVTAAPGQFTQYYVIVRDTVTGTAGPPVTISIGSTTNAPSAAVVGNFVEVLGNSENVFTWPPNARISVISSATGSTLRCTAGYGS